MLLLMEQQPPSRPVRCPLFRPLLLLFNSCSSSHCYCSSLINFAVLHIPHSLNLMFVLLRVLSSFSLLSSFSPSVRPFSLPLFRLIHSVLSSSLSYFHLYCSSVPSCPVLSCPVLSCPVLSCPVLSCQFNYSFLPRILFLPYSH